MTMKRWLQILGFGFVATFSIFAAWQTSGNSVITVTSDLVSADDVTALDDSFTADDGYVGGTINAGNINTTGPLVSANSITGANIAATGQLNVTGAAKLNTAATTGPATIGQTLAVLGTMNVKSIKALNVNTTGGLAGASAQVTGTIKAASVATTNTVTVGQALGVVGASWFKGAIRALNISTTGSLGGANVYSAGTVSANTLGTTDVATLGKRKTGAAGTIVSGEWLTSTSLACTDNTTWTLTFPAGSYSAGKTMIQVSLRIPTGTGIPAIAPAYIHGTRMENAGTALLVDGVFECTSGSAAVVYVDGVARVIP